MTLSTCKWIICTAIILKYVFVAAVEQEKNADSNSGARTNDVPYERTFMKYHHRRKIEAFTYPDYEDFLTGNDFHERFKRHLDANAVPNLNLELDSNEQEVAAADEKPDTDYSKQDVKDANLNSNLEHDSKGQKVTAANEKPDTDYTKLNVKDDISKKRAVDPNADSNKVDNAKISKSEKDSKGVNDNKSYKAESETRKYKVKAAIVVTNAPTTAGPRHACVHKYHRVAQSEQISAVVGTHSPTEEKDDELVASDKVETPSRPYNATLPDGSTALVEDCSHSCYALWLPNDNGTLTVLGQGCWQTSSPGYSGLGCAVSECAGGPATLPGAYFCCCHGDYCNHNVTVAPIDPNAIATPKAASTMHPGESNLGTNWSSVAAYAVLAAAAVLVAGFVAKTLYARRRARKDGAEGLDVEKADGMGPGQDALATGLLCVDNLTLIEHIGAGKFGSVWSGSLGGTAVAVKLYGSAAHWQREAAMYCTLHHANLLRYYGSDARPTLTDAGGRQQLIVVELCEGTLRQRLQSSPLTWQQFASLAHGLASAVAYLHSVNTVAGVHKACVVHRDINSNNVLVSSDGSARLADLGLAVTVQPLKSQTRAATITEAGTLRYLAPEALEGALDLAGARAALCAVDVFALGLVLWEMLWRTSGAHAGPPPAYAQPYQHAGLGREPSLTQMQALVSRGKVRPPLPRGPVTEARALRLAADTCDECWDHDAEARLTAVCVEERLSELKHLLEPTPPLVRDNNLHPHTAPSSAHSDSGVSSMQDSDKNSNCLNARPCDVTTPLLYAHPHIGRNPCLERNTHTQTQSSARLIHKSLKDIAQPTIETPPRIQNINNCMSVERLSGHRHFIPTDSESSDRFNEIRSFQRHLDYVPNDVSCHNVERMPKQTNIINDVKIEKPKWGLGRFFGMKNSKSVKPLDTEVKLIPESNLSNNSLVQSANGKFRTSVVVNDVGKKSNVSYVNGRPSNLTISENEARNSSYNFESPCTLSPPNRTLSPTMMMESQINKSENKVFAFKELPHANNYDETLGPKPPNQIFAVIVPKAKCRDNSNFIEMHSKTKGSSESIHKNSVNESISSQSLNKSVSAGNSEVESSEDSTVKKSRLSCDDKIITSNLMGNSGTSSRASMDLELQYLNAEQDQNYASNDNDSYRSDCSSSIEDENLMLLSENGGSKITMQAMPKPVEDPRKKYQNEVLKEASVTKDFGSFCNKFPNKGYANFDNEFSDPNDKENLNSFSGDNPVYIAAINGEINTSDAKFDVGYSSPRRVSKKRECKSESDDPPKSPKPSLKYLTIKRQHSLEQVSEIFSSSGDLSHLQNPAGRVKTPGDIPVAVRRARRDRALLKGRAQESNRLSLYDDRMMFGNSL